MLFHGDNTGSNPVGDANILSSALSDHIQSTIEAIAKQSLESANSLPIQQQLLLLLRQVWEQEGNLRRMLHGEPEGGGPRCNPFIGSVSQFSATQRECVRFCLQPPPAGGRD